MAITSVGVGSGLELESLIKNIVEAERAPVKNRLDLREAEVTATISGLGSLKSTLADFQTAVGKLKAPSAFQSRTATSTNTAAFTATAQNAAELGSYDIQVVQQAKTQKLASGNFANATAQVGAGSLSIDVGGKAFQVSIEAGVNDTLAGIRDAINNASGNTGVRASLMTVSDGEGGTATKLMLTAAKSGSEGAIKISATDADGDHADAAGLSQLRYDPSDAAFDPEDASYEPNRMTAATRAQDAIITIDGFEVRSSTNTFSSALQGVEINVLKEPEPEETLVGKLAIGESKTGIRGSVEGFVASYNALMGVVKQLTVSDPAAGKRALMSGDSSVSLIQSRVRSIIGGTVEGAASDFNSLAFLGVSTNRDGTLALDATKLGKALDERYDDVGALFTGENGIAGKLDRFATDILASNGMFATRQVSLDKQLDDIDAQRTAFSARLEKIEARYRSQFSALDIMVSQLTQTGDFLQQQLAASASIINRDRR